MPRIIHYPKDMSITALATMLLGLGLAPGIAYGVDFFDDFNSGRQPEPPGVSPPEAPPTQNKQQETEGGVSCFLGIFCSKKKPSLSAIPIEKTKPQPPAPIFAAPLGRGVCTSAHGLRLHPTKRRKIHHDGIDLAAPRGDPIYSITRGEVVFSGQRRGYGWTIDIRADDGSLWRYAHNQKNSVQEGARVGAGQTIATLGSSGTATGPHLHLEYRDRSGNLMDPQPQLMTILSEDDPIRKALKAGCGHSRLKRPGQKKEKGNR